MMWGDIIAATTMASACALSDLSSVALRERNIRVEDVVAPHCALLADRDVRGAILARTPASPSRLSLTRAALARLLRRRIPTLNLRPTRPQESIIFVARSPRLLVASHCYAATAPLHEGQAIARDNVSTTACVETMQAQGTVRYDRTYGRARAARDLEAGAYLGPLALPDPRAPDRGDALTIVAIEGPTRIERPVTALEPASRGGALFVRDQDGHIFAAPLPRASNAGAP